MQLSELLLIVKCMAKGNGAELRGTGSAERDSVWITTECVAGRLPEQGHKVSRSDPAIPPTGEDVYC